MRVIATQRLRQQPIDTDATTPSRSAAVVMLLFFGSGLTGLVYQVLWMHQCARLFGNTAQAAAMTVAIFFLGIAAGSRFWGKWAPRSQNPLRTYALLELAIAASALSYFVLLDGFYAAYGPLVQSLSRYPAAVTFAKTLLASALLLPPAFFMGGTFPMMGQHLVHRTDELGRTGSLLYGLNTVGGAAGAFAAGFILPAYLGYSRTYLVAIGVTALIAATAYAASRRTSVPAVEAIAPPAGTFFAGTLGAGILAAAFVSGFTSLGLEVLWTRMFAQVLHNSVYSFAIILVTFLLALAAGAALANRLATRSFDPFAVLALLATTSGVGVCASAFVFNALTDGLGYIARDSGWTEYVLAVFGHGLAVMMIPGVFLGALFPYLLHIAEGRKESTGSVIGQIAAVNTLGAVSGSLVAGFVLPSWLGLWAGIRMLAVLYLLMASLAARAARGRALWLHAAPLVAMLAAVTLLDPTHLPIVRSNARAGEAILETWESGHGVVAVVERKGNRVIKLDNYYTLGGTVSRRYEQTQADLPIMLHQDPKSIFFLGLGTGITAGAALSHPVASVTAVELIPDVITASRLYFKEHLNGLFDDPRARVLAGDGRQQLRVGADEYDVIVADLFIPWQAGASSLYSKEHFETCRERLKPEGLFAQWLPLYQLTRADFFVIARTMLEVFPQVTVWRGDFLADRSIVALIGQDAGAAMDVQALIRNFRNRRGDDEVPRETVMGMMGLFYAGNLSGNAAMFTDSPINTDDFPVIEYHAPVAQRHARSGRSAWFTSFELLRWYEQLFETMPPDNDPFLVDLTAQEKDFVRAGLALYRAGVNKQAGRKDEAAEALDEFSRLVPDAIDQVYRKQLGEKVE
jgi:spermidine synthase